MRPPPPPRSVRVAIVGAGAAGLVAAREMLRAGHAAVVFEASPRVGGVWAYEDVDESDDAGAHTHSSLYPSLRTNLPRELMAYSDFPFAGGARPAGRAVDDRTYPSWRDVLDYLETFADATPGVRAALRLGTRVVAAKPLPAKPEAGIDWPRWAVTTQVEGGAADTTTTTEFDALVVANGHYKVPRLPAGVAVDPAFTGAVLHAHTYRGPDAGPLAAALAATPGGPGAATVAVFGAAASGEDIGRELAHSVATVHLCAREWDTGLVKPRGRGNIRYSPPIAAVDASGFATFTDGSRSDTPLTAIIFCTGYHYAFDFLDGTAAVAVDDNQVLDGGLAPATPPSPLYEHAWPPSGAPGLTLLGLPYKVVPFPLCEAQARRAARALSGEAPMPGREEMAAVAAADDARRQAAGIARRHAHRMGSPIQFDYCERVTLAAFNGDAAAAAPFILPQWRRDLYDAASEARRADGDGYRDADPPGGSAAEGDAWARAWVAAQSVR